MENMEVKGFWHDKRVLLTGHTGFKGAWMAMLLSRLGARVTGYALAPESELNLFDICNVGDRIEEHHLADVRDRNRLADVVKKNRPDVIFHMAAQSLVRRSYKNPLETFGVNVMGTATLLDVAREIETPCAIVIVTTDKVYENDERNIPFRESDPLGAADPYSTSKAAAELVTTCWRKSFRSAVGDDLSIASVRAGNVIGGGDWAQDRLIPDCIRSFKSEKPAELRNPDSVRPWQHVLDPIRGYMMVAERLLSNDFEIDEPMWNFGPTTEGEASAAIVAQMAADCWGRNAHVEISPQTNAPQEASLLRLDSTKAHNELGWDPIWQLSKTIAKTIHWYRHWAEGSDMTALSLEQIDSFLDEAPALVGLSR